MSTKYDFRRRLYQWLERMGFIEGDPFSLYEADREGELLQYFFIDRPYLHEILGDPAHPQAAFLLAGRGEGKTATREIVAYECAHAELRRRALAVQYNDFGPLLSLVQNDLAQIEAHHHVRVIIRNTLKAIAEKVPPTYLELLNEMERALLGGYSTEFADPISQLKLRQLLAIQPTQLDWAALSPVETLGTLAKLVTRMGREPDSRYQAVYVLVDRVDETALGPEAAIPLLEPLISEGPLLEMPHVAFKFFLPTHIGVELHRRVSLRPDRVCLRTITWDYEALERMIQQRLSYYSAGGIERLEEIFTTRAKANAMERLIRACGGSPRTLIRLCKQLVHRHIERIDETRTAITYTDLIDTIREFEHQIETEQIPALTPGKRQSVPSESPHPPESGLYLDENGHVWVDGEMLEDLSRHEFRLLEKLYWRAPEIVSHEELIEAVWPASSWMTEEEEVQAMDKQNLRKLVARLRDRLPGSNSRFVKNVRGRGYWLDKQR